MTEMSREQQIEDQIAILRLVWLAFPEQRLGQLVANAAKLGGWKNGDVFYVEEDRTTFGLGQLYAMKPKPES